MNDKGLIKALTNAYGYDCSDELAELLEKLFSFDESESLSLSGKDTFEYPVYKNEDLKGQALCMGLKLLDDGKVEQVPFDIMSAEYPSDAVIDWQLRMSGNLFLTNMDHDFWLLDLNDPEYGINYWYHAFGCISAYHVMTLKDLIKRLEKGDNKLVWDPYKDESDPRNCIFDLTKELVEVAWEGDPEQIQEILDAHKDCAGIEKVIEYLKNDAKLL